MAVDLQLILLLVAKQMHIVLSLYSYADFQ